MAIVLGNYRDMININDDSMQKINKIIIILMIIILIIIIEIKKNKSSVICVYCLMSEITNDKI